MFSEIIFLIFIGKVNGTVEDILQSEIVRPAIQMQDKVYEAVKRNMQTARNRVRARKQAAKAESHTFSVGEKVLRRNVRSQQRKGGKLDRDFLGPFTIVALQGKSADLRDENGLMFPKINLDHLIPFLEQETRIPHRLQASSDSTGEFPFLYKYSRF